MLQAITTGDGVGSGLPHGDALSRLVNATLIGDAGALQEARRGVLEALGVPGLVDAAAVIATFTMQNRIADATGLPLDTAIELATRDLRVGLGADGYGAAALTSKGGRLSAALARLFGRLAPTYIRLARCVKRLG